MAELLERPRHDEDFYAWALDQAKRLRAAAGGRGNEPIDWEDLAEELEIVAKRDLAAAGSYLAQIIHHLLKIDYAHADLPLRHWCHEVRHFRRLYGKVTTKSLENRLRTAIEAAYAEGAEAAEAALHDDLTFVTRTPVECPYSYEQIVGAWWPERVEDIVAEFRRR